MVYPSGLVAQNSSGNQGRDIIEDIFEPFPQENANRGVSINKDTGDRGISVEHPMMEQFTARRNERWDKWRSKRLGHLRQGGLAGGSSSGSASGSSGGDLADARRATSRERHGISDFPVVYEDPLETPLNDDLAELLDSIEAPGLSVIEPEQDKIFLSANIGFPQFPGSSDDGQMTLEQRDAALRLPRLMMGQNIENIVEFNFDDPSRMTAKRNYHLGTVTVFRNDTGQLVVKEQAPYDKEPHEYFR